MKKETLINILIMLALYVTFCYANIIEVVGTYSTNSIGNMFLYVFAGGVGSFLIFELAIYIICRLTKSKFGDFKPKEKSFKFIMSVCFIARNIILGSINFLFMRFPISSVWGMLLSNIVITTGVVSLGYFWFVKKNKLESCYGKYLSYLNYCYCFCLALSLIIGGML